MPNLPDFPNFSPALVRTLDKIRYEIDEIDDEGELFEFYWFAREYPRFYRHHLSHAEHRLTSIHEKYIKIKDKIVNYSKDNEEHAFIGVSNPIVNQIYWDFESYLMALSAALDLMARIIGVAYNEQTPVSFNKICSKKNLTGPVDILRKSKDRWVNRFKDYRDCFAHYTPVDSLLHATVVPFKEDSTLICKLPINPNIRTVEGFRYSRSVEVLKYASTLYRHFSALDKAIAKEIMKLYNDGNFPRRTKNLFYIGQRTR